eukprot:g13670.t1
MFHPNEELGVTPPLGFWDPLGFSKFENPEVAKQQFKRRRIVEIQHGRVAMLACIGYIVPEYFRFPGLCSPSQGVAFADIPNGLKGAAAVPLAGWLQIITFVGIIEVTNLQKQQDEVLGDYGYGAFGLPFGRKIEDGNVGNAETFQRRRETEIKHGRVAMYATMGYIVPEYFKWPGIGARYLSPSLGLKFEDVPNGLAAITKVPGNGWAQIVAFAGYYELFVYKFNGTPGGTASGAQPVARTGRVNLSVPGSQIYPSSWRFCVG